MNTKLSVIQKTIPAIILMGSSVTLLAGGFRVPDQDAFATARAEAFAATADTPSALYYNPAGISQLEGQNLRAGVYGIYLDPQYEPPSSSTTYHNEKKLGAVPHFFYTCGLKDTPVTFGLGLYSPFGLATRFPQTTGFRTIATQGQLMYETLNPVVSLKLCDTFSIAAGLTVNYANADLRQGILWPTQPYDSFRFAGEGWAVGYNFGALWKPHEKISFGVSFRSQTDVELKGHTSDYNTVAIPNVYPTFNERSAASAEFQFPLIAIFGVSYRPTPAWNFEFDADYAGWNNLRTVTIHQDSASVIFPQNIPLALNWQSSWYYEFGGTRYFDNGWHVSAGYVFNENSMPDSHYLPTVADMDKHFWSAGTGYKGKRYSFDIAYQFGWGSRTVVGSTPSFAGQTADGHYDFISHAIAVTAGMNF